MSPVRLKCEKCGRSANFIGCCHGGGSPVFICPYCSSRDLVEYGPEERKDDNTDDR